MVMPAGATTVLPASWGLRDVTTIDVAMGFDSVQSTCSRSLQKSQSLFESASSSGAQPVGSLDAGWLSFALASNLSLSCSSGGSRLVSERATFASSCSASGGCAVRNSGIFRQSVYSSTSVEASSSSSSRAKSYAPVSSVASSTQSAVTCEMPPAVNAQSSSQHAKQTFPTQSRRRSAGILRVNSAGAEQGMRERSKSEPRPRRSVSFSDTKGLPLVHEKEPDDWLFLDVSPTSPPPAVHFSSSVVQLESSLSSPITLKLSGEQPVDCADFRIRLSKQSVCLERAEAGSNGRLRGLVRVLNSSFTKKVFVRLTEDDWKSFVDVEAEFCDSRGSEVDRFAFNHVLSSTSGRLRVCEFAVCYQVDGREHWDNNHRHNYVIRNQSHPLGPVSKV